MVNTVTTITINGVNTVCDAIAGINSEAEVNRCGISSDNNNNDGL